jgi:hypothetical protein
MALPFLWGAVRTVHGGAVSARGDKGDPAGRPLLWDWGLGEGSEVHRRDACATVLYPPILPYSQPSAALGWSASQAARTSCFMGLGPSFRVRATISLA